MHGQSSRHTANTMDAVECMITTNDLELETDVPKRDDDRKNKSRRNERSYENSNSRPTRRSPPSVTRKHPPSPISSYSSSSSRSRNHHSSSQRHHRNSSPSPPPLPPPPPPSSSSSRHQPSTRPIPSTKRAHSPSSSSRERRQQPAHRSRTDYSAEKSNEHPFTSSSTYQETKTINKQDKGDLSLISEDESSKKSDIRNSTAITQSSPLPANNGLHPVSMSNESLFDTSFPSSECELSLFAKSTLSNSNTNVVNPSGLNNLINTYDFVSKLKTIATTRGFSDTSFESLLKEIPLIIQKEIDLQKTELDVRERELKLRERELAEREKRFQEKAVEVTTPILDNSEPIQVPTIKEERTPVKSENINQDLVNISPEESVVKTISSGTDNSNSPATVTRKAGGKSRFSPIEITPPLAPSVEAPVLDIYSIDSSTSKKSTEPILSPYSTDLKVTSSSTSRKVEIQTGLADPSTTKSSAQDLRLTLSKNRSKYSSNEDEQTIEISPRSDEKQSSGDDYQSQRSITSTPIEPDVRQHRQQYSSNSFNNPRSYNHGSSLKYRSNQKRGENPDLRSRLYEQKNPKSSRSTYKNTH